MVIDYEKIFSTVSWLELLNKIATYKFIFLPTKGVPLLFPVIGLTTLASGNNYLITANEDGTGKYVT